MAIPATHAQAPIFYPESDGKPVGETDVHITEILDLRACLTEFFRDQPDVYVAGNLLLYYEEGNPAVFCVPDGFVVRGVKKGPRRVYKLWEEGAPPCAVFEITSRSTRLEDQGTKRALYAMLGVPEYFLFDPLAEYLRPPLQGFRLAAGEYQRIAEEPDGALLSQELGLLLRREAGRLRLTDVATGAPLLRPAELFAARRAAEEQAQAEAAARRAAEEQAQAERQRAEQAESELERLRAELERLRARQG